MEVEEQIQELNNALDEAMSEIDNLTREIKSLKNKPPEAFWDKEQELKDLKGKLQSLQNEKDACSSKLKDKIDEVKNSNMSKEEKADKLVELVSDTKTRLDKSCHSLSDAWIKYGKTQEKLNEILEQKLKMKDWVIKQQETSKKRMSYSIYGLLGAVILLSLSLSLSLSLLITTSKKIPGRKNPKINI